jgi:hypothetical protein
MALKVGAKFILLKSIVKSQRIIGEKAIKDVKGTVNLPKMPEIEKESLQKFINLGISQV